MRRDQIAYEDTLAGRLRLHVQLACDLIANDRHNSAMNSTPTVATALRVAAVIELGSQWGHLLRMLPLMKRIGARGHHLLLAARDVEAARAAFSGSGAEVIEAPVVNTDTSPRQGRAMPIECYAQLLDRNVFGDDSALREALRKWRKLLQAWRPDVIVTDFAPTALLAAHLHRIPVIQVAIGWESPPLDAEWLPVIHPPGRPSAVNARTLESGLLARINCICREANAPQLPSMSSLYAIGRQLLATWPESDHFAPRASGRYIGPIYSDDYGTAVRWPAEQDAYRRLLVYLSPDPRSLPLVQGLQRDSRVQVVAILPQLDRVTAIRASSPRVRIHSDPIRLADLMPTADLVVSNGGHGLMAIAMRAGVPMLTIPRNVEQALFVHRLEVNTGAVRSLLDLGMPDDWPRLCYAMANDQALQTAAQAMAQRYAEHHRDRAIDHVIDAVEEAGLCHPGA